jgi:HK97 family phage portal protein
LAEEPEAGFRARLQAMGRSLLGVGSQEQKDIWGPDWRAFMGIDSGSSAGVREITDQPGDYGIARTTEPYLWRALDVRAKALSQVPLRVCTRDDNGRKTWTTHPALDILKHTNAFGYVAGLSTLMRYTLQSLDLYGRCTWKMAYDRKGRPSEVYWLVPGNITPLHGYDRHEPNLPFWGVRLGTGNNAQDIKAKEIVYFTTDNPSDPILGTSKVSVLKNPINLRAYSQRSNMDFFKNSMRPDWLLHGAFRNTEENVERIRRAVRRHLSGDSNRMPLILGENMTATLLTTNHNDAEWIAQQRLAQEEISSVFGVPVIYLNNLERATYDNIQTAKLILWHDTMIPEGDILTEALTRNYLWRFWPETIKENLEFSFDYAAIEGLGEDIAKVWERTREMRHQLTQEVLAGQITPNESRGLLSQMLQELGFDSSAAEGDVPGGNSRFLPYTNLPIEQLSVQAIIDIMAARGTNPQLEENVPGAPHIGDRAESVNPDRTPDADPASPGYQVEAPKPGPKPPQPVIADTPTGKELALVPETKLLIQRLKRFFQDVQSESLRTMRVNDGHADVYGDLYDRDLTRARLRNILIECHGDVSQVEAIEGRIFEELTNAQ